jgi:hypothetical protein
MTGVCSMSPGHDADHGKRPATSTVVSSNPINYSTARATQWSERLKQPCTTGAISPAVQECTE